MIDSVIIAAIIVKSNDLRIMFDLKLRYYILIYFKVLPKCFVGFIDTY